VKYVVSGLDEGRNEFVLNTPKLEGKNNGCFEGENQVALAGVVFNILMPTQVHAWQDMTR
jgi:hypothetical protein